MEIQQILQELFDAANTMDLTNQFHPEVNRLLAVASTGTFDESKNLSGVCRSRVTGSPYVDRSVLKIVVTVTPLVALVAWEYRLAFLWRLCNDKQDLMIRVDSDPAELEGWKLGTKIGADTVFELMSLGPTRHSERPALLRTDY